jgi:transposase-like protein
MELAEFEAPKSHIAAVSTEQKLALDEEIQGNIAQRVAGVALARRTRQSCSARVCPHCQSNDIAFYGKDQNGRQRFKCRVCHRTYNILTGTPMARACKPEKWGQYISCMTEHMSVRKIVASGIGVHQVTAWRWRHRFLQAAANDIAAVLSGVVEADTTLFRRSFKGSRGFNKATPRKNRALIPAPIIPAHGVPHMNRCRC